MHVLLHGPYELGEGAYLHFLHDIGAVNFDGLWTSLQQSGDLLVGLARHNELHDLALTGCKPSKARFDLGLPGTTSRLWASKAMP